MTNFKLAWFVAVYFDLIKELARSLAWPLVVIIVTIRCKEEIRELVPRMRRAGPAGVEFDPRTQQDSAKSEVVFANSELPITTYIPNNSPSVQWMEDKLRSDLPRFEKSVQIDVLLRELASARLAASFEFILNLIFGSQIEGLKALDQRGSVSIVEAEEFFEQYRKLNPEFYTHGFNGWLDFLKGQNLVKVEKGVVSLTELGKDFLVFLTRRGVPYSKPF